MKLMKNCQTMKFEKQQLGNFLSKGLFNSLLILQLSPFTGTRVLVLSNKYTSNCVQIANLAKHGLIASPNHDPHNRDHVLSCVLLSYL
jgi:hypothetical protein